MEFDPKIIEILKEKVGKSRNFLVIPHKSPDGDALGSALGLYRILKNMGKEGEVRCFDAPPSVFAYMPHFEEIKIGLESLRHDLIIIVDSGATHLTGFHESHPQLFNKSLNVLNIDHHPSNDAYGLTNVIVTSAASTTEILANLALELEWPLDRHAATCFLTGIYTDTGSMMHSNTKPGVLRTASKLLSKGANLRSISKDIFNTTPVSTMRLWGRVLRSTYQTSDGVTYCVVTEQDFKDTRADYNEVSGVVDYINSVPNSTYSVMLSERDGKVKGSLRTLRHDVDVAKIAEAYGGGGHVKAAGFSLPGKLEKEVRWKVVDISENYVTLTCNSFCNIL